MKTKQPFWRAPLRFMLMMSVTLGMSLRYAWNSMFRRQSPEETATFSQKWADHVLGRLGVEIDLQGQPTPEGCILIANHRSYTDIPVLMKNKPCTFLAKKSIASWPIIGWAARLVQTVFVDRDCKVSRNNARSELKERLKQGISVIVFAEGTTSPKGVLYPMKPGMFYVAAEHGLPIVPVAIEYETPEDAWVGEDTFAGHFLRQFRKKKMKVSLKFGHPIKGNDGAQLLQNTETWLRRQLQAEESAS